ncbi:peptidoglycan DD-metalloendopeptidase family protein [Peterkaempfera sp. SMS 1(5)a]|uniref:M23 family metallopeptidase n=1 Tax=Peterkaempfera podocarpi TaxID=3232308 RepID=UPI00367024DA
MASEGRHRRPRSTSAGTAHRLVLAAGVTGAGLGVPVAAATGRATPHHPAGTAAGGGAGSPAEDMQNAAFTGAVRPAASSGAAPSTVHVVAPGETLSGIARSHRVPGGWQSVYLDNREVIGDDPDLVRPGERLHLDLPAAARDHEGAGGRRHVVRRGESLSSIAEAADVDGGWQSVYLDNREVIGDDPDLIHPGQRLVLPAPGTTEPARQASKASALSAGAQAVKASAAKASAAKTPAGKTPAARTPAQRPHTTGRAPARTATAHTAGAATAHATLPVHGYTLTAGYHAAGSHWANRHTGQDFAVPSGTPVSAVLTGTVVTAGWGGAYGNEVVLRHHDGSYTVYAHLSSIAVHRGQTVVAGARLGRSGATGNVTGPHLHFEVRNAPGYGSDIDPVAWLERHGLHI